MDMYLIINMKKFILLVSVLSLVALSGCSQSVETESPTDSMTEVDSYVGMSEEEAQLKADENDVMLRVVERDGNPLPMTMDYRPGRINATVENGLIVDYYVEGGELSDNSSPSNPDETTAPTKGESYSYYCDEGNTFTVYYGEKVSGDAIVKIADDAIMLTDDSDKTTYVLTEVTAASGTKYENEDGLVFWNKGFEATVMQGEEIKYENCKQAK